MSSLFARRPGCTTLIVGALILFVFALCRDQTATTRGDASDATPELRIAVAVRGAKEAVARQLHGPGPLQFDEMRAGIRGDTVIACGYVTVQSPDASSPQRVAFSGNGAGVVFAPEVSEDVFNARWNHFCAGRPVQP